MVRRTTNAKTGPVDIATSRTHGSCPTTCPLWGAGCYAENNGPGGRPTIFAMAEKGTILEGDYSPLSEALDRASRWSIVRFNVSGDYLGSDGTPDMDYIEATNHAKGDVLSYTHAWRKLEPQWFEDKARPQASCDTLLDVTEARDRGWSTVIVDPGLDYSDQAGFITCLYDTHDRQCMDCRLCTKQRRSTVVFPVHGQRKRLAATSLQEVIA